MARRSKSTKYPVIHPLVLPELNDCTPEALLDGQSYEQLSFHRAEVSGKDLSGSMFTECELVHWSAGTIDLRSAQLREVIIDQFNIPVVEAERSTLHDVRISHSRMGSAVFYDAEFVTVVVSNSKLDWLNFRGAVLRDVIFRDCVFQEIDLLGAKLQRVVFENCTVGTLNLEQSSLKDVDLRGLEFKHVLGLNFLRGATLTAWQTSNLVEAFAAHHGITIEG